MCSPVTDAELSLPALSLTFAVAERLLPSPVTTLSVGQVPSMFDSASEQVQRTVTSPLYQPLPFGPVVGEPEIVGAVLSTLMPLTVVDAVLPAASETSPVALWSAPS